MNFSLSPGNAGDEPEGRGLLQQTSLAATDAMMDCAYEGDETRQLVRELACVPVVPPTKNRKEPWDYDRELCKQRHEVERLFRRLQGFRRIFTRFDKLCKLPFIVDKSKVEFSGTMRPGGSYETNTI